MQRRKSIFFAFVAAFFFSFFFLCTCKVRRAINIYPHNKLSGAIKECNFCKSDNASRVISLFTLGSLDWLCWCLHLFVWVCGSVSRYAFQCAAIILSFIMARLILHVRKNQIRSQLPHSAISSQPHTHMHTRTFHSFTLIAEITLNEVKPQL